MKEIYPFCIMALIVLIVLTILRCVPAREYFLKNPIPGQYGPELQLILILFYGFRSIFYGQKPEHKAVYEEELHAYEELY